MAKITYYNNPMNLGCFKKTKAKTLREALVLFGIEKKPLCVVINGKCPEDFNIDKKLYFWDKVEIYSFVSGSRSEWGDVFSIVTTIAAISIYATNPYAAAFIAISGALVSGALKKQELPDTQKNNLDSVLSDDKTLQNIDNQVRKGQNIPLPIGSVRFAPDVYTYPFYKYLKFGLVDNLGVVSWSYYYYSLYSQTFCFGFGDMEIKNRRVGLYDFGEDADRPQWGDAVGYSSIYYGDGLTVPANPGFIQPAIPPWYFYNGAPVTDDRIHFFMDVDNKNPPAYANGSESRSYVPGNDHSQSNWSYFESRKGQDFFFFMVSGFAETSAGVMVNSFIQIQIKLSTDTDWTDYDPNSLGTQGLYNMAGLSPSISNFRKLITVDLRILGDVKNTSAQVRIRKSTNDDDDKTASIINTLAFESPCFYESEYYDVSEWPSYKSRWPMNIEGLYVTSFFSENTSNQFTALVESKCYVFDGEDWNWEHTRNPAWWFLYFARGGFLNEDSWGMDTYPFSPTKAWQNYPGHPGNSEKIFGGGFYNEEIDIEKIIEWAYFCDENELKIDAVLRDDISVAEYLERIANVGRGSVYYDSGKLSVVYEDKNQIPVTMFGMANIISGSFSCTYQSINDVRKIVCKFNNRENNFDVDSVEAIVPFSSSDSIESIETTLQMVTDPSQAQKECNLLAARQFFQTRKYQWSTDHEGFLCKRGDLVYLSHDSTQFGYSGRIERFILSGEVVEGFYPVGIVDESVTWVSIRMPDGEMKNYSCHKEDDYILFDDEFLIEDAPWFIKNKKRDSINEKSIYIKSQPDDYIYIADIKETPGKIVRISTVEPSEDHTFLFTAVDEDPAMWAYENGVSENPESIDDSIGIVEIYNLSFINLGAGKIRLSWNSSEDCLFMVVNNDTDIPFEINGRYSISENVVDLQLDENIVYNIKVMPIKITEKVVSRPQIIEVSFNES